MNYCHLKCLIQCDDCKGRSENGSPMNADEVQRQSVADAHTIANQGGRINELESVLGQTIDELLALQKLLGQVCT